MTDAEFRRISTLVKDRYGIDLTNKAAIVEGRLNNTLFREGFQSYTDYLNAVEQDSTGEMEKEMVNILTTNHTYFMREFDHLDFLRETILPYLKEKEASSKDLRIWCAASSTGEEPYMIAMTILQFFGFEHAGWDTKILATDISTNALESAIRGEYSLEAVEKVSEQWKRRFFKEIPGENRVRVTDEVKNEVLFRQFNLMEPLPFRKKMHTVFMRNVMIYFDQPTKNDLVKRVYDAIEPGGYLIIGMTEAIDTSVAPFEMVSPSIFRKPL